MSSMKHLKTKGLYVLLLTICFNLCHKNIGKGDRHFSAHGGSVCLKVVTSIELE